jgi:hypothetical protein
MLQSFNARREKLKSTLVLNMYFGVSVQTSDTTINCVTRLPILLVNRVLYVIFTFYGLLKCGTVVS